MDQRVKCNIFTLSSLITIFLKNMNSGNKTVLNTVDSYLFSELIKVQVNILQQLAYSYCFFFVP